MGLRDASESKSVCTVQCTLCTLLHIVHDIQRNEARLVAVDLPRARIAFHHNWVTSTNVGETEDTEIFCSPPGEWLSQRKFRRRNFSFVKMFGKLMHPVWMVVIDTQGRHTLELSQKDVFKLMQQFTVKGREEPTRLIFECKGEKIFEYNRWRSNKDWKMKRFFEEKNLEREICGSMKDLSPPIISPPSLSQSKPIWAITKPKGSSAKELAVEAKNQRQEEEEI